MIWILMAIVFTFCLVGVPAILELFDEEDENGSDRRADQEIRSDSDQRADASGGPVYAAGPSGTIALTPIAGAGSSGANAGTGGIMASGQKAMPLTLPQLTPAQMVIQSAVLGQVGAIQNQAWGQGQTNSFQGLGYQNYQGLQQAAQQHLSVQHQIAMINAALYGNSHALLYGNDAAFHKPKPIVENAGIVLGEIESYRAWRIFNGCLVSLCVDDVWLPGEPMTATDVREDNTNGAHAFKTAEQAMEYGLRHENVAVGRVKLWGQIIEHELGYRAEFSKPIQILSVRWHKLGGAVGTVEEIAKRYGIPGGNLK